MRPGYLFLLFTLFPILELALLIEVGQWIGTIPTVLIVLGTGLAGAYFARAQGISTLRSVRRRLERGEMPAEGLIDGLLILIGGAFLVAPGLLTDAAGLLLVLPASRKAIKNRLRRKFEHWVKFG